MVPLRKASTVLASSRASRVSASSCARRICDRSSSVVALDNRCERTSLRRYEGSDFFVELIDISHYPEDLIIGYTSFSRIVNEFACFIGLYTFTMISGSPAMNSSSTGTQE